MNSGRPSICGASSSRCIFFSFAALIDLEKTPSFGEALEGPKQIRLHLFLFTA
jgi:hypothetical protein